MDLAKKNVGGRERRVRALLATVLAVVTFRALRAGKRKTGLLTGIGALGLGLSASTQYCTINDTLDRDTTTGETTTTARTTDTTTTTGTASRSRAESKTDSSGRTSGANGSLTCASCGEPIRVGQGRGPNEQDEIVHDDCL